MISEKVKKWVIKAIEDFKSVEHEFRLSDNEIITSIVCFHCQQFVEKMFKAYLTTKLKQMKKLKLSKLYG